MSTMGDILSTVGDILSTMGDIMMCVGDIMSTVEGVQYHGGYHPLKFEYCGGCSVLWGTQITKDFPSMVLMNPPCAS